jgi:hypothetical protein
MSWVVTKVSSLDRFLLRPQDVKAPYPSLLSVFPEERRLKHSICWCSPAEVERSGFKSLGASGKYFKSRYMRLMKTLRPEYHFR